MNKGCFVVNWETYDCWKEVCHHSVKYVSLDYDKAYKYMLGEFIKNYVEEIKKQRKYDSRFIDLTRKKFRCEPGIMGFNCPDPDPYNDPYDDDDFGYCDTWYFKISFIEFDKEYKDFPF